MMYLLYIGLSAIAIYQIFVRIRRRRRKVKRGREGEKLVQNQLLKLPKRRYNTLNNVLLSTSYGTTQIDHIVVSRYGIFVIETKNYKGRIYGTEQEEYWTQYLYEKHFRFYNPIKQNNAHILTIQKLLKEYRDIPIISVIAFSEEATLDVFTETPVVYYHELNRYIRSYKQRRIRRRDIKDICEIVHSENITQKQAHKEHRSTVKMNVRMYEESIKKRICPRCGNKLIKKRRNHKRVLPCKDKKHCNFTYRIML